MSYFFRISVKKPSQANPEAAMAIGLLILISAPVKRFLINPYLLGITATGIWNLTV
jgi:hypothetical protein